MNTTYVKPLTSAWGARYAIAYNGQILIGFWFLWSAKQTLRIFLSRCYVWADKNAIEIVRVL
jgi:hypothetical protein